MSNGDDDKYRSRKWMLAVFTEIVATIGGMLMQLAGFFLVVETILPPAIYTTFAIGIGYVWLFTTSVVLSGYGIANVMEKWSLK